MNHAMVCSAVLLMSFMVLGGVLSDLTTLHHTVAPVAVCDPSRLINPHKKIDECHLLCNKDPKNYGKARIYLYKDVSGSEGPAAVRCEKVMLKQVFTETWTFSRFQGPLTRQKLPVTSEECEKVIQNLCPNLRCDVNPPAELKPEYFYAADHEVRETHMKVRSVPSTLINQVGTLMIVFATESSYVEYQPGKVAAEDGTHMYYWDNTTTKASCPFEESISFGCDKWNLDGSVNYVCSHGRFAFESSGSIDVRNCPKARMSPEGIIYREEDTDMATLYTSQRIAMIPGNKFAGDLETVRTLTANGLAHLDADICSLECEIANLELRTSRHYSSLVRTGAGYVLVNPSGHAYDCSKVTQCSVIKPYTFCGSPPRIHIKCDGRDYYWSPEFSHIMTGDGCPSPMPEEQFKIHLGNHLYYLEDDMTIKVPANYTNSLRTRSYTLNKGSLIELEDLRELRASWKAYKTRGNLSYFLDSSTKISTHSLLNMQWIPDVGKFVDYVRNSFMTWERVCLISVIVVLSVYVSKPIIYYILNKKKVQVPRQISYQRPEYQMEFI